MQCLAGTCYLKHVKTSVCKLRILDSNSEVEICFWMDLLGQHSRNHFNIKKRRYWHCRTQILDVWDMLVWGALLKKHEFYIILASLRHWMQCLAGTCYLKHVKTSVCKLRILDSNSEVEICFWMDLLGPRNWADLTLHPETLVPEQQRTPSAPVLHPQWITPPSLRKCQQDLCNLPQVTQNTNMKGFPS